jgi:hypothetical protein
VCAGGGRRKCYFVPVLIQVSEDGIEHGDDRVREWPSVKVGRSNQVAEVIQYQVNLVVICMNMGSTCESQTLKYIYLCMVVSGGKHKQHE